MLHFYKQRRLKVSQLFHGNIESKNNAHIDAFMITFKLVQMV